MTSSLVTLTRKHLPLREERAQEVYLLFGKQKKREIMTYPMRVSGGISLLIVTFIFYLTFIGHVSMYPLLLGVNTGTSNNDQTDRVSEELLGLS